MVSLYEMGDLHTDMYRQTTAPCGHRGHGHGDVPTGQGRLKNATDDQKPGERRGTDSPSELPEGSNPANALISDFGPPGLGRNTFLVCSPSAGLGRGDPKQSIKRRGRALCGGVWLQCRTPARHGVSPPDPESGGWQKEQQGECSRHGPLRVYRAGREEGSPVPHPRPGKSTVVGPTLIQHPVNSGPLS